MKQLLLYMLLCATAIAAQAQTKFDSAQVIRKMNAALQEKQQKMPPALKRKDAAVSIENRVDFSAPGFDYKRAGDASYLQTKAKKVMVIKFADIKQAGNDIYVQTAQSRYPLSNMEVHADANGKMMRELPYDEIRLAMQLLQNADVISPKQVSDIFNANRKSAGGYSYMNLLIDLTANTLKWQVRGTPDQQKMQQELLEIDAVSGKILLQQMKTMNVAPTFISQ